MNIKPLIGLLASFFLSSFASADLGFDAVSSDDVSGLNKDFSALLAHTTLSPAAGLLKAEVFELGLIFGLVSVPNIASVSENSGEDDATTHLPNTGLVAVYSYTRRLSLEFKLIPDLSFADLSLGSQSLALKLSFGELDKIAFNTALRWQLTNSYVRTQQVINNSSTANTDVDAEVKFSSISTGLTYMAGYRAITSGLTVYQPYAGAGFIYSSGRVRVDSGTGASIFESGDTTEKSSDFGWIFLAGVEAHYLFIKYGAEYSRVFESDRLNLKLSFGY